MATSVEHPPLVRDKPPRSGITSEEAKLYDRQIRLWGVEAQKNLRAADVLIIGLSGTGSEIGKTVVLAGINSITFWDPNNVTFTDSLSALFTRHAFGKNRACNAKGMVELLNPMVGVYAKDNDVIKMLEKDPEGLKKELSRFTVVVLADYPKQVALQVNDLLRQITESTVIFYYTGTFGKFGFGFVDAGKEHKYLMKETAISDCNLEDDGDGPVSKKAKVDGSSSEKETMRENEAKKKETMKKETMKEKSVSFVPLSTALGVKAGKAGVGLTKRTNPMFIVLHVLFRFYEEKNRYPRSRVDDIPEILRIEKEVLNELGLPEEHFITKLRESEYERSVYGEYSPITTIVGGVLGQDLIRCITHQTSPIRNFFLFSGHMLRGYTESFGR